MWRTLILLCAVGTVRGTEGEWREVKSPQGPVRGRKDPLGLYVFSNIPYATAPKGSYRFSAPLPPPAWLVPLETPEKGIICPQPITKRLFDPQTKIMQEDCLIANVYVPITDEKKVPVVVYVHGGAFQIGFGDLMTPKNFAKENNVIVVTFNYRLGVHGFLCLGTDAAPGNAGLKDQVALLKWVQKNIASYGGDPEQVTIAGFSAGSVSADLLMLVKAPKGLFSKVILESGTSVGHIAIQSNPLENAKTHAKKINFTDIDDVSVLEQFYKNTPLETLVGSESFLESSDASPIFTPCVERKTGSSALLLDSPVNIINKGKYNKIPILLGFTNMEGLIYLPKFELWKNAMNDKFSDFLPTDLRFENEDQKQEIAKMVKGFYFGDEPVNENTVMGYIDYFSDILFRYPTLRSVKMHADNGHEQIYLYEYSFVDDDVAAVPFRNVRGATHCAQTGAIFDGAGLRGPDESNLSEEHTKMKKTMRTLWHNFIVHGKPVAEGSDLPAWPSAGADRSPHMSLAKTVELRGSPLEDRVRLWDEIYDKHYQHPVPPPKPPHTEL